MQSFFLISLSFCERHNVIICVFSYSLLNWFRKLVQYK
jgi:hypothetical protein